MFDREDHLWGLGWELIDLTLQLLDFVHSLAALVPALGLVTRGLLLGLLGSSTGFEGEVRLRSKFGGLERGLVKEGDMEGVPVDIRKVKAERVTGRMRGGGGMRCEG